MPPKIEEKDLTPLMRQYLAIKKQHENSLLFYRMGDFYEMFWEDAEIASRELDITLTARDKGPYGGKIPLAGIPYHALDNYLPRLVGKGYRVAIAEQVEDPKKAKGIVKREVVQIVTPGTMVMPQGSELRGNNYLTALVRKTRERVNDLPLAMEKGLSQERVILPAADYGVAHIDISTGDFYATQITSGPPFQQLITELINFSPAEIVIPLSLSEKEDFVKELRLQMGENVLVTSFPDHFFMDTYSEEILKNQLKIVSLQGVGLEDHPHAKNAAGAVLAYARENQMCDLDHIRTISFYQGSEFMVLDSTSLRNLEILRSFRTGDSKGTLLSVLDHTRTAMGSRLMRNWIQHPLMDIKVINNRLDAVSLLNSDLFLRADIKDGLKTVSDLERIVMRFNLGRASARDLQALRASLGASKVLRGRLAEIKEIEGIPLLNHIMNSIDPLEDLSDEIGKGVVDEPPLSVREGRMIRDGYSSELDEIKAASKDSKQWLKEFEANERRRTGIRSLKVKFNSVFGYYIEVTKSNLGQVPDNYIRKQTLVGSERFITPELKEKESLILNAEERLHELEYQLFMELSDMVKERSPSIQETARSLARLDVINTLADVAARRNYVRPEVDTGREISIRAGRHPVIEDKVEWGFVPNDARFDGEGNRFVILTGPNMAGKSTYMRQIALIVIMAQMGSFVPAEKASIGAVDRIFTRVGASDDLVRGQSTFMVEMLELANILNSATDRSLIVLDEIGRGTSTFDGLSIAWAVTEYISDRERIGSNAIFATHYHHLTELEGALDGVVNYHMSVKEGEKGITFLRKVRRGSASGSYGVEVAGLAGIPPVVVDRAREILSEIEKVDYLEGKAGAISTGEDISVPASVSPPRRAVQMVLFPTEETAEAVRENPVLEELRNLDLDNMTPLQAMEAVYRLRKKAREED
ncbi:MAG: DNA mismatch repair protein MutS [Thermoplasmatota archaeon]